MELAELKRSAERCFGSLVKGAGVPLTMQSGGNFRCPCPIHKGEDPNFSWSSQTGQWFCNSQCSTHGDVFDFVQGMGWADSLPGAVGYLQKFLGTSQEDVESVYESETETLPIPESELRHCQRWHPYWKRVPTRVRKELEGGYCDTKWHALYGRVTLPVRDTEGTLIGIIGRITQDKTPEKLLVGLKPHQQDFMKKFWSAKYYNFGALKLNKKGLPSGGFRRRGLLYHYHKVKDAREPLLLVEGPFDVAMALAHGWYSTIAVLGKDITQPQRRILLDADRPIVCGLDSDSHGNDGAMTIRGRLEGTGVRWHRLLLPSGMDVGCSDYRTFWYGLTHALSAWEIL